MRWRAAHDASSFRWPRCRGCDDNTGMPACEDDQKVGLVMRLTGEPVRECCLTRPLARNSTDQPGVRPKTGFARAPECPALRIARVNGQAGHCTHVAGSHLPASSRVKASTPSACRLVSRSTARCFSRRASGQLGLDVDQDPVLAAPAGSATWSRCRRRWRRRRHRSRLGGAVYGAGEIDGLALRHSRTPWVIHVNRA